MNWQATGTGVGRLRTLLAGYRNGEGVLLAVAMLALVGLKILATSITIGSGGSVAEISPELPEDSLLVSIRRADGSVVFPRGDTLLQAGDHIVAYAPKDRLKELRRYLGAV